MLRNCCAAAIGLSVLLTVAGCETVETTVLIGERATQLPANWSGSWQVVDKIVHFHVEGGTLHAAGVEWTAGEFRMQTIDAIVTTLGDHRILHIATEPEEDEDAGEREVTYSFLLLEQPENDVLLVRGSNAPAFRKAVVADKLKGEVIREAPSRVHPEGKPNTTLLRDKESLDAFIRSTSIEELFNHEEPLKLKRIVLTQSDSDTANNK